MDASDLSNCKNLTEEVFVAAELFEDSGHLHNSMYSSMEITTGEIQQNNFTLLDSFDLDVCTYLYNNCYI